jgi:hypothetical protein
MALSISLVTVTILLNRSTFKDGNQTQISKKKVKEAILSTP